MTLTRKFCPFLYTAMIVAFHCSADGFPPPTDLSFRWLDNFTVSVSWKKPSLSDSREVRFLMKKASDKPENRKCIPEAHVTDRFLTEEIHSDHWMYNIWTVDKDCHILNDSIPASITIHTPKPRAEVVKGFQCLLSKNEMNCSWKPVNRSLDLTLYYRICGDSDDQRKSLKKCDQLYRGDERNGCYLQVHDSQENVCIFVDTEAGMSTFKPALAVPPTNLSIEEEGDKLKLSWTYPEVGNACVWTSEVCYERCDEPEVCLNKTDGNPTMEVLYKKSCRYKFRHKVGTAEVCPKISSNFSETFFGNNEPPDRTLTVLAIVIPIILSVCVILSCYCFRRHSAIICPIIPDPSAIFKEMMMNGNKELKTTTGSLYTPVPEPVEPCKITLVAESGVQQKS